MLAADQGHLEVVKYLHEHGCSTQCVNFAGNNALMLAAKLDLLEMVQYLAKTGLNINQLNFNGYTAFAISTLFGDGDVACDLIMQGASLTTGLCPQPHGYLFWALRLKNTALINLLIPLHDVTQRCGSGCTPLMHAAADDLIEVAVPMIRATMQVPEGRALVQEAFKEITTEPLFKELLKNPSCVDNDPSCYSQLSPEGEATIQTQIVFDHVSAQRVALQLLQNQLGSGQSMTPMQEISAQVGILAELPAWKLSKRIEKIFNKILIPSLAPIQKRIATFISDDIEVLATQANGWEDNHLVPVVEHLYLSCLTHSLSANPAIGIVNELTDKGLYHPIARRIAGAWVSAWAAMSEVAKPLLLTIPPAQFDDWDLENLADLDPINGEVVVIRPDTLARSIARFVGTPTGDLLLQAFRDALKNEFDSADNRILHADDVDLSEQSKNLYADLIMRQLHLIAQFWRAETE